MDKVVFVHAGHQGRPHPVHGKFASSVSDVFVDHRLGTSLPGLVDVLLRTNHLPKSDIYLAENSAYLPVALKKKFGSKFNLIAFFSDPVYELNLLHAHLYSTPYKILLRSLLSQLDGAIVASEHMKNRLRAYTDIPMEVSEPFIGNSKFKELGKVSPNLSSRKIITIGSAQPRKGLDILEEAFHIVTESYSDVELYLIGKGTEKWDSNNIHGMGWVDNPVPYLKEANLYVRPSWHEGFCVASLEAMRAGLPAIVTEGCGEKELVREVKESFVSPITPEGLAKRIKDYLNMGKEEKIELSERFRSATSPYREEKKIRCFKKKFKKIMRAIDNV